MKYKLLFNMVIWSRGSLSLRHVNEGLAEIGRIIILHIAAGVSKENLELAIVVHGSALNVYLKNDVYQKKFKTDSPNLEILNQIIGIKTRLMACGQTELYTNIPAEDMIPDVKTAFSANVVLSTYQLKGYILYNIEDEK
jgi:intracellular sulfur oxidation DsrE/DsrF family protein